MGRKKNNPSLVQELIDGCREMSNEEFIRKYDSLSSSDMKKVCQVWVDDDDILQGCVACANPAYPN